MFWRLLYLNKLKYIIYTVASIHRLQKIPVLQLPNNIDKFYALKSGPFALGDSFGFIQVKD